MYTFNGYPHSVQHIYPDTSLSTLTHSCVLTWLYNVRPAVFTGEEGPGGDQVTQGEVAELGARVVTVRTGDRTGTQQQ